MDIDLNLPCGNDGDADGFSGSMAASSFNGTAGGYDFGNSEEHIIDLNSSPDENESGSETDDCGEGEDDECTPSTNFDNGTEGTTEEGECSVHVSRTLVESLLNVGCYVDMLDEVHVLYREYGRLSGFSVRKGSQRYFFNSKYVRWKIYHCSCAGLPDNKASIDRVPVCKRQSYRCNCEATLRVCRDDIESPWKVTMFENDHNHELVDPSESYLLRSACNMSQSKKTLLIALTSSGIGVSRAYRFMEIEAGCRANIGFLRKDAYNELNSERRRLSKVPNADVNRLLEYFTQKGLGDPSFYWKVKVGDDGRLKNLYFRDTRCLVDYQYFGDVISVDATYKTNKYDLVCVPIIGISHHRTNVLFGMAFLSNEKTESYEWLFSTFLESMHRKEPLVIFSDQDQALMNGLDNTFCQALHRLCQWHINKNAVKQFGKLNHNREFKSLWYRCMNGCKDELEFKSCWNRMTSEFDLLDNRWFKSMYNLRKRWSSAYSGDKFCGGLHATSRSEVTNKVIKELCCSTSSVFEFVLGFEKMQKNWRTIEFEEDVLCQGMLGMFVQRTGIMLQLSELCTRSIVKVFEAEVVKSITVKMSEELLDLNGNISVFKVLSSSAMKGFRVVTINEQTKSGKCSCHKWETEGIICRHLFKVYFHLNFDRIPDEMILNRWRCEAKDRLPSSVRAAECGGSNNFTNMVFLNHNTKRVYDLLNECKDDKVCRDAVTEYIGTMIEGVRRLMKGSNNERKEKLHRPIRNPMVKKKRNCKRKMYSRMWERGGETQNETSNCVNDTQGDEPPRMRTAFGFDDHVNNSVNGSPDRFSMD